MQNINSLEMGWPKISSRNSAAGSKGPQVPPLSPDLAQEAAQAANSANGPPPPHLSRPLAAPKPQRLMPSMAYNLENQSDQNSSLNSSFGELKVDAQPKTQTAGSPNVIIPPRTHSNPTWEPLSQTMNQRQDPPSPVSVYMSPPTFSPSMLYPTTDASIHGLPVITVNLPDLQSLIDSKGAQSQPAELLEWSKNVLSYVERRERTLSVTGVPYDRRNLEEEEKIAPLVDHAVQVILTLAASSNSTPKPVLIEALYLRADMTSSGAYSDHRPRDPRAAFRDFEAAAKGGFASAWFRIGREYEQVPDVGRAVDAYQRGIKFNDCSSLYRIGTAYLLGQLNLAQDPEKAIPLLRQAAERANIDQPNPAYVFGMILAGEYDHVSIDPSLLLSSTDKPPAIEAKIFLERAAYYLYPPALYKMGLNHEFALQGCQFDPLLSIQYYSKASELGEFEADMALSKWFLCGHEGAFAKDEKLAFTFAEKAARGNLPSAEFALGYYYEVGVGGIVDLSLAKKWYARAAEHGNDESASRLAALEDAHPMSRDEHNEIVGDRLVRRRTQAKKESESVQARRQRSHNDAMEKPQPMVPQQAVNMQGSISAPSTAGPVDYQSPPLHNQPLSTVQPVPQVPQPRAQVPKLSIPSNVPRYSLVDAPTPIQDPLSNSRLPSPQINPDQTQRRQSSRPLQRPVKGPATFNEMGITVGTAKKDPDCVIMSVTLEPAKELIFPRPVASPDVKVGTAIDKEILKIKNPTATPVAFKVKTTAPRSYCVRPNAGRIEPGQTIDVQVLVQAVKDAPPIGAKCKDKFLVQSVHINESRQSLSVADFWLNVEREDKNAIIEQKIRCNWKMSQFETVGEEDLQMSDAARSNSSNTQNGYGTTPIITATPYQQASELPQESTPLSHLPPVPENDIKRGLGIRNDSNDIQTLPEAKQRIAQLEQELTQMRQSSSGFTTATATHQTEGVPLQMVAGIVVSVFVITYLFL
ncbi:hypothetical protein E3Q19_04459 [Wallemia mellicola]|nr:hypothetical protein E3Q19_04459 [Wallemia mellicola]